MRVLAAAFEDPASAQTALEQLRDRYGLSPADASIAPLGNDDRAAARTVLAGRFPDTDVQEIRALVAEYGGQVVSEVDETWTRSSAHESLEADPDNRSN